MSGDKFQKIAEEASQAASSVPCSREAYIEGLEAIIEHLQIDIEAAKETTS